MIRESVNRVVASAESGVKLGNGNLDQSAVGDIQRDLARYCASDVGKALNAA